MHQSLLCPTAHSCQESLTLAIVTLGIVANQLFNATVVLKGKLLIVAFIQNNRGFPFLQLCTNLKWME